MILFDPARARFPQRLVVFASGRGTNMEALHRHLEPNLAQLVGVFSDRADQPCLEKAKQLGLKTATASELFQKRSLEERDRECLAAIQPWNPDWICLAGYMKRIGNELLRAFPHRILNIHPSLLPSFPGAHGQRDAWEFGSKVSGATVHLVDEEFDHGPIVAQKAASLSSCTTVEDVKSAILQVEHQLYSEAINDLLKKGCRFEGRRVELGV